MPEVFSITPGRGRAGDPALALNGAGFAPIFPGNTVEFDGNFAVVAAQDETDITAIPPSCFGSFGFCVTDEWIGIAVQRKDSLEWTMARWWVKADLVTLQTDSRLTERIPTGEDLDGPTNEFLTATTWNRLVTFVEWLAHEILSAKGSVLSREAAGLVEVLVGPNGSELRRVPAAAARPAGLIWGPPRRVWTYRWGRLIDAANTRNGAMRANGAADDTTTGVKPGTHGMARSGVLRFLTVNVESATGGDTLDQVTVVWEASTTIHDSGASLAIGADDAYQVELADWRFEGDLEVRAFKTGTAGTMELTAILTVEEEDRPSDGAGLEELLADSIAVTDSIDAVLL